ncbi:MAG: hypothetical protein ACM34K_03970 [Bacillota bacterium]
MKKYIFILFFFFSVAVELNAQICVSGGMGIDLTNTSSLNDYISLNNGERRADFNTNVEFFGEIGYMINPGLQIGAEYALGLNSYNNSRLGYYDLSYNNHMPSALAYYVISGQGYRFKFGGGAGYRFISLDEARANYTVPSHYTASGIGFLLRADGNTTLGGNLFADISVHMRMDYVGELKGENTAMVNYFAQQKVNLNSFAVGIRLGLSYYF